MRSALVAILLLVSLCAHATTAYPDKPIRLIVPVAPGRGADITARAVAQKLAAAWGQQIIIDNRAGAGGTVGMEIGARATPDGYTLIEGSMGPLTVDMSLYSKLPYDSVRDFTPIARGVTALNMLVVHPSLPVNNVRELIAYLKANPNKVAVATSGRGSNPQLWALAFMQATGTQMIDVPYKGSGAAHPDLLSGQTQVMFDAVASVAPHVKAGKLKILAVGAEKRSPYLPDVPTMQEAGVPGYAMASWGAVIVPAKTPKPIVDFLYREIAAVLSEPDVKERMAGMLAEVIANPPAEAARLMNADEARLTKLIRDVGLPPE